MITLLKLGPVIEELIQTVLTKPDTPPSIDDPDAIILPTWVLTNDDIERLIKNAETTLLETRGVNNNNVTAEITTVIKLLRNLLKSRNST